MALNKPVLTIKQQRVLNQQPLLRIHKGCGYAWLTASSQRNNIYNGVLNPKPGASRRRYIHFTIDASPRFWLMIQDFFWITWEILKETSNEEMTCLLKFCFYRTLYLNIAEEKSKKYGFWFFFRIWDLMTRAHNFVAPFVPPALPSGGGSPLDELSMQQHLYVTEFHWSDTTS